MSRNGKWFMLEPGVYLVYLIEISLSMWFFFSLPQAVIDSRQHFKRSAMFLKERLQNNPENVVVVAFLALAWKGCRKIQTTVHLKGKETAA